ncbi:MAG: hypothetical protein RLZZ28_1130 [Bacteroidota bacterium]
MHWFGIYHKHLFFTRTIPVTLACMVACLASLSFIPEPGRKEYTKADTTLSDKHLFKSLFTNSSFDATKPYEAQLNPRAVSFVQEYIRKQGKELEKMKTWGKPYFDLYDNILGLYGIPKEMKYLSVIESHLSSGLVSWAGAVGPWQLMDYEAKRFGLRTGNTDDRTDYYKSTHVAAKLMKELYGEFGDWLLVVAAYNGGAGRLRQAMRKSGSKDFWDLQYYLPEETRNHVKKFIGTHYAFEGMGGWTTMTAAEVQVQKNSAALPLEVKLSNSELESTILTEVNGRYHSSIICNRLELNPEQFNRWNPGFDKAVAEGKKYPMRLEKEKALQFNRIKSNLLMESLKALLEGTVLAR